VDHWTQSPDQDLSSDGRGWKKNRGRAYSLRDEQRVLKLHRELDRDPEEYFSGASAIDTRYREVYPAGKPLSLRFIGRTLAKYGLSQKPKVRVKGASRYLHYPAVLLAHLGESLLEMDFIGKKFIEGRTAPINFIGFSLTRPRRLKYFQRVQSETASEAIEHCQRFFERFEKPDVIKIDNGFAFAGTAPQPRVLNAFSIFLLQHQIIPVFTAQRKPWNQASIEGSNSIFSRKFWRRERYTSLEMIDNKLKLFNTSYQNYLGYTPPKVKRTRPKRFIPKVYFIRKVYEDQKTGKPFIEILHEHITLPKAYAGMFVLAEWNLKQSKLNIRYENDGKAKKIKQCHFVLNQYTRKTGGKFLFVM